MPGKPLSTMKQTDMTNNRLARALDAGHFEYVALYLLLGAVLLLKGLPPDQQKAVVRSLETDPHPLEKIIALVDAYLDAGT